jgi:hypothetical protein
MKRKRKLRTFHGCFNFIATGLITLIVVYGERILATSSNKLIPTTVSASVSQIQGRDTKILSLQMLTVDNNYMQNDDFLLSSFIQPIALKHFNERYAGIIKELGSLGNCTAKLQFTGDHIIDTKGDPYLAMTIFLDNYQADQVDIIEGPTNTEVSLTHEQHVNVNFVNVRVSVKNCL